MTETGYKDNTEMASGSEEVEQSLEKRDIAFEALFRLFEKIGTTFDLEMIIKLLLMTVVGQLGLRRVAFFLRRERSSRLDLHHSIGLGRYVEFPSFSLDSSFMKWMDEMDGVVMIDDFFKSDEIGYKEEQAIGNALVNSGFSYVCDLKEGDKLFGIMAFSQKVSGQCFSEFDRELLVMMARVAAITIRNASLYQSVLRSRNELENFSRMKKEFINHTSHELRTPITVLRSSLWLIETEGDEAELMSMARDSVLRLEEKVGNILSLNKMDINVAFIEPLVVEISGLVISTCREMAETLEEREIILDIRNKIGEKYISVDPSKVKGVLRSMLENAVNSIERNGNIQIRLTVLSRGPGSDDGIEISAWDSADEELSQTETGKDCVDSWLVISIIDDGRGIPLEEISTIGKPFQRASNSAVGDVKGFGVGLSVAQKIVAAHGGYIYCKSVENKGSGFSIWFPGE